MYLCTTQNTQNKIFDATKSKSSFCNVKLYNIFDDSKYDSFATTQEFNVQTHIKNENTQHVNQNPSHIKT